MYKPSDDLDFHQKVLAVFNGKAIARRWRSHVRPAKNGCWRWTGCKNASGYGQFSVNGKPRLAHRATYELFFTKISRGYTLDHTCGNRWCVSIYHLEVMPQRENLMKSTWPAAENAKKTHCPSGHEYTAENTRLYRGKRYCKACKAASRRKAAANSPATPEEQ